MKTLFSLNEIENYKSREKLPLECEFCHGTFYTEKNNIQWALKKTSCNYLRFCSRKCRQHAKDNRKEFPCHLCGKITKHKQREIKNSKFLFCSTSCSTVKIRNVDRRAVKNKISNVRYSL